jgi:hypothetical protein
MRGIRERWQGLSKKWRLIIGIIPVIVILAIAIGVSITLNYFAENPSACGNCHIMQTYVNSYYDSNLMDSVHAKAEPEVKCKDCHQVTLVQQTKELIDFVTGNYETPLKQNVQIQNRCINCHTLNATVGAIRSKPEFTEDQKLSYHLTVENGKVGCYDGRAAIVGCQDCHGAHKAGVNYCIQCHYVKFGAPKK